MKLLLLLRLLTILHFAGHILAIWNCKKSSLEHRQHVAEDYDEDLATPRPTIYWCAPKTTQKYLATIENPTSSLKTFQLPATSYGILNISNTNNLAQDVEDLRRELRHQFEWEKEWIPYLGEAKSEAREIKMAPNKGAIFFQSLASCVSQLRPEFKKGNAPVFEVATQPFRFELPKFGNCVPKDQYLPIRPPAAAADEEEDEDSSSKSTEKEKEDENAEFLFPNQQNEPKEQKVLLRNYGFMWKLAPFHHLQPKQVQETMAGPNGIIPANDPLIASIRKEIMNTFIKIQSSPVTKASWKPEFFDALPLTSTSYSQEIVRTIPPKSTARFFQLAGQCGNYTVYTSQIYKRVYNSKKKCVEFEGSRDGIEKCNFCADLKCANEAEFFNKIEYVS